MFIKPVITPPLCTKCQTQKVLMKKKTSTGGDMYACPNWAPNNMGCTGDGIWFPPKPQPQSAQGQYQQPAMTPQQGSAVILGEIRDLLTQIRDILRPTTAQPKDDWETIESQQEPEPTDEELQRMEAGLI